MTAMPIRRSAGTGTDAVRCPCATTRAPGLVAFAATLVLAAITGLPRESADKLIPQGDDRDGPFLGI